MKLKLLSCVWLFATPWTVAFQAPPSMGFSRQEYWNGLPFPSPGDLPNPGIEPGSSTLQADSLLSEPQEQLCNVERSFILIKIIYLFICLYWVLVVAGGIFSWGMWTLSCSTWGLVPWLGIESQLPAWGAWNLVHWTTREVHGDILECHMREMVRKSSRQRLETHPNILPCTG